MKYSFHTSFAKITALRKGLIKICLYCLIIKSKKVSGLYIDVGYKTLKKIQILKLHVIDKQFFSKLR